MSMNGGNQTVPTVLFPDGSTLTNPRLSAVVAQLARRILKRRLAPRSRTRSGSEAREVAAEPSVDEIEGDRRAHRQPQRAAGDRGPQLVATEPARFGDLVVVDRAGPSSWPAR